MILRSTMIWITMLLVCASATGQDIHFSNYSYSPLYLSPAKTGSFSGSLRFGANVRDQFSSFIEKPYQTLMAYADMPIAFGFKGHHWIGVGVNVFKDRAGDLNFQNTGAHLSLAYHYSLDPKYKTVITLGAQFGMTQRDINADNYRSAETLSGNANDPDQMLLDNFNPSVGDFNVGLDLKRWTSKTSHFNIGVSIYHLTQTEFIFTGSSTQNKVARRYNVFAEYHIQRNKQLAIRPLIMYSRMINFQNLFGQVNLEYKPNRKSDTLIKAGIGYRNGDALQFLAGMVYNGWDIGAAFDLTVSSAAVFNNNYGGIEIGIKKIIITNKKPKLKQVLLCPRY